MFQATPIGIELQISIAFNIIQLFIIIALAVIKRRDEQRIFVRLVKVRL